MQEFNSGVETISPQDALRILEGVEDSQISARSDGIDHITKAISEGRWLINGDAIVFGPDGDLVDGIKRVAACAQAGVEIETVVARGVSADDVITIGTHRKRRTNDYFKVLEVAHHSMISKVVNALPSMAGGVFSARRAPHHTHSLALYERYSEELDRTAEFVASRKRWVDQPYSVALWHFLFSQVDPVEAERFIIEAFEEGSQGDLDPREPARVLHNRLYKEKYEADMRLKKREKYALIALAWNARVEGRELKALRWTHDEFPKIAGWKNDLDLQVEPGSFEFMSEESGGADIEVEAVLVTPEIAEGFLERNLPNNRRKAETTIKNYARDMKEGRWRLNGQAIKFDEEGVMIDGQHRCEAGVRSGSAFMSLVVRNVPRAAFVTYDDRPGKRFADVLLANGVKYATHVASLVDRMVRWDSGQYHVNVTPTLLESEAYFNANPQLAELVRSEVGIYIREADRRGGAKLFRPTAANFVFALLSRFDRQRAEEFITKVFMGGEDAEADAQISVLRNHMMNFHLQNQKRDLSGQGSETYEVVALIKTWNAWVKGEPLVSRGIVRAEGEAFPMPVRAEEGVQRRRNADVPRAAFFEEFAS